MKRIMSIGDRGRSLLRWAEHERNPEADAVIALCTHDVIALSNRAAEKQKGL
jgi:hypothetical protein